MLIKTFLIKILTCFLLQFSFVKYFEVYYHLKVGSLTYLGLVGLAFVFAPTFQGTGVDVLPLQVK